MLKGVSLRGLEVFEALAATGSVAGASQATGLSLPAVSQQMRNLETALGVELVDHARRPMVLTPAGRSFLTRTRAVLGQLRLAQDELSVMELGHLPELSLGMIDDFDNDLTPRLVTMLADSMAGCRFRLITAPSHEIKAEVVAQRLHVGVAGSSGEVMDGVVEHPLVLEPYILVCARGKAAELGGAEAVMHALPFLRYDRAQLIGRQVEAQLKRLGLDFPDRFEIGSHLSLMTLVARGAGWTLTTPMGYMRAARQHGALEAHPLPFAPFARTVSLFAGADWGGTVPRDMARTLRHLIGETVIAPALEVLPWLDGELRILDP